MRYIDSLNLKESIECFILIEPGMGYIIPVLKERFKKSKIIALHAADSITYEHETNDDKTAVLCGANKANIKSFLEAEVPDIEADLIKIIEWRPSLNFYKEDYISLLSQTVEFLKRTDAGNRTTAVFGKRWVRNFFKNLSYLNKTLLYRNTSIPVIVAGSGPSLEQALPLIAEMQDSCLIIAASSSVMALSSYGITADIIIATDGGPWALRHLYPVYRTAQQKKIAVNLCAALPSQCSDTPFLIINDGSLWQSIVLHELSLPSVIIPQKGTVTAAAAELAMLLSSGNIFFAGADFSINDIRTHVRPYAFDSLFFSASNRFTPYYSRSFSRSRLLNDGGSMDIYAAWFKEQLVIWDKRVFSLTKNKVFKNALPEKRAVLREKHDVFYTVNTKEDSSMEDPSKEGSSKFSQKGINALLNALDNQDYAEKLTQELTTLLLPNNKKTVKQELKQELIITLREAVNE